MNKTVYTFKFNMEDYPFSFSIEADSEKDAAQKLAVFLNKVVDQIVQKFPTV